MDDYKQLGPGKFLCSLNFPFLTALLQSHGKSINDLLQYQEAEVDNSDDYAELRRLLNRSRKELKGYFKALERDLEVQPSSLDQLFISEFITTGLPNIDNELGGGIPLGEVTEVFGASGCGKSHFLFQLLANCRKQYPTSENIHISTESFLETKRLKDIIGKERSSDMELISYIYCHDLESQDHILYTQLPAKLRENQGKTKLVVIDSIAQHFRREDSIMNSTYLKQKLEIQEGELLKDESFQEIKRKQLNELKKFNKSPKYASRTAKLYYICLLFQHLSRLAQGFNIAVVIINQVSDYALDQGAGSTVDALAEELEYPLNMDFQTAISSGWDGSHIYQLLPNSDVSLNHSELETLDIELMRSFDEVGVRDNGTNKRQKVSFKNGENVNVSNTAAAAAAATATKEEEDRFELQKDLIYKSHKLRNRGTKRIVPTLGYPWAARIKNKIMLMKTYKPILKSEQELSKDVAMEPVAQPLESFNAPDANGKRSHSNLNISDQSNSLIKGWQVERFAKVVSSSNNHNSNRFMKFQFMIHKHGLVEI